ncbi:MAG: ABC transporter permease [Actinomycetota bacterium]|jgi:spermidine/putrescine transport system permease protein
MRKGRFLPIYTGGVIAYLFLPIIVMILFGFNDYRGRFNFTWEGFTLHWYRDIFDFPELTLALKNSLTIAAISTLIATILGTLVALALTRYRFRGRSAMNLFIFLPMASPEIVLGAALLSLFVTLNLARGFTTIVIAHIMFSISYVVVTVKARTSNFDLNLEDAAQDLGASPWITFWTVTFPLIFPGILAAGMLAAVLSIDDYVITSFNAGGTTTLPLWIFGASRIGVPAQVNVMGTLIFMIGVVYVLVTLARAARAERPAPSVANRPSRSGLRQEVTVRQ